MSTTKSDLVNALSASFPTSLLNALLDEYQNIKRQFALGRFGTSELNGGRFSECVVRMLEHLNTGSHTPLGTSIRDVNKVLLRTENNVSLKDGVRLFVPKVVRVLIDVRNRRDVAHVGGDVSPNYADSLFVSHGADWVLTELVRTYYGCSIDQAKSIVANLNELHIPIVAEVNGFVRIQNTDLSTPDKVMVILYHKMPDPISDSSLSTWLRYKNTSRFRKDILGPLDKRALIHYEDGMCTILPKGVRYVDQQISLEMLT